jgi:hypothetical protein
VSLTLKSRTLKPNVAHEAASAAQRFSSNLFSHMTLFFY